MNIKKIYNPLNSIIKDNTKKITKNKNFSKKYNNIILKNYNLKKDYNIKKKENNIKIQKKEILKNIIPDLKENILYSYETIMNIQI